MDVKRYNDDDEEYSKRRKLQQSIFVSIPPLEIPSGTGQSLKTACGIMLLVLGFAVPLRGDLTVASFSPRLCWGTD